MSATPPALLHHPAGARADRIAAHKALARDAWKLDGDAAAARAEIDAALQIADEPSPLWSQRGRIEFEAQLLEAALASAERGLATSKGDTDRAEARSQGRTIGCRSSCSSTGCATNS